MPPLSQPVEQKDEPPQALPVLGPTARIILVGVAVGLMVVFAIAICLRPYGPNGQARTMETHRQLGLPPCSFYELTGVPCPSCGMTTSFSLLMHGDVWSSLQANAVGTGLAIFCLLLIPWCLTSAWLARPLGVWSIEWALMRVLIVFLVVLFLRWGIVLGLMWLHGDKPFHHREIRPSAQSRRGDDGSVQATLAAAQFDPGGRLLRCGLQRADHALLPLPATVWPGR